MADSGEIEHFVECSFAVIEVEMVYSGGGGGGGKVQRQPTAIV